MRVRFYALAFFFVAALLVACGGEDGPGNQGNLTDGDSTTTEVDGTDAANDTTGGYKADTTGRDTTATRRPEGGQQEGALENEPLTLPDRSNATPDYNPDPDETELQKVDFDAVPLNENRVKAAIEYPQTARAQGISGTVYLKVLVDLDGYYKRHILRGSPSRDLTNAVVEKLPYLRYDPARLDGKPVKVWVNFEYTFKP